MINVTVNNIELPSETYWTDEFKWTARVQSTERSISGGLIVQTMPGARNGRPMTLKCIWMDRNTLALLEAWRDGADQSARTVSLPDGRTFSVILNHGDDGPLAVTPIIDRVDYSEGTSLFNVEIRLLIV